MFVYHLDRGQHLCPNKTIDYFFPSCNSLNPSISLYGFDKVSSWGLSCYNTLANPENNICGYDDINTLQIELNAEIYRKNYYPQMPSRFKCIFAFESLSDIKFWNEYFKIDKNSSIYRLEIPDSNFFKLDARFLKCGIGASVFDTNINMQYYWSGKFSATPLPELLIPLPVRTLDKLKPSELEY